MRLFTAHRKFGEDSSVMQIRLDIAESHAYMHYYSIVGRCFVVHK